MDNYNQYLEPLFTISKLFFKQFLNHPFDPSQRIYWVYLLSSLVFALYLFIRTQSDTNTSSKPLSFLKFIFPAKVWANASAWLDVRYFFFHSIARSFIYGVFLITIMEAGFRTATGGASLAELGFISPSFEKHALLIATVYMFVLVALSDFVAYVTHYLQHKIPFLWEFHKVHHSAVVMHPLSNYREHPFDNVLYALATGLANGMLMGTIKNIFGYVPDMPTILGLPVLLFAFNFLGYNLRHSHIWFRWPGNWAKVFASSGHHHIHHSYHPDHINKNFAFIFPWWDVLFHTYHLPETNKDVTFGLSDNPEEQYRNCLGLYFTPVKNSLTVLIRGCRQLLK